MNDLNQKELIDLTGGSFGMDVGWLLGHLITGHLRLLEELWKHLLIIIFFIIL